MLHMQIKVVMTPDACVFTADGLNEPGHLHLTEVSKDPKTNISLLEYKLNKT